MKNFIFLVFLFLWGCGSTPYIPPQNHYFIPKTETINKPFDDVWRKSITWFASNNTPIKNLDKSSGYIATDYNLNMKYENDLVDCGCSGTSWNTAYLYYNVVGNLNAMIVPYGKDSVTVTVNVFYKGIYKRYDANGKLIDFINADCQSTGKLERDFLFYITQ